METLVTAIHRVYEHGTYFEESAAQLVRKHGVFPAGYTPERELSGRELIILKLICAGKPQAEIAGLMGIKEKNGGLVQTHVASKN